MAENEKVIVVQKTANQLFRTKRIWQYDVGHTLRFDGFTLPNTFQVHFASSPTGDSIPQIGQDGVCTVPAQFAQNSGTIYAWVYVAETDTGLTKYKIEIPVEARGAITNQEPTPVEQSAIDQAIAALNAGVTAVEAAQEAAETAQAGAESARDDAVSAATQAANSATDANASREAADVSATNAGVSERNAKASEDAAKAAVNQYNDMTANATGLPEGSSPTAEIDHSGSTPVLKLGIPKGDKGDKGDAGEVPDVANKDETINYLGGDPDGSMPRYYILPNGGIPKTDLSSGVQASLNKADSAYQKPQSGIPASDLAEGVIPSVPVQDVQVNGTSVVTDGVANVPMASANNYGVVQLAQGYGTMTIGGKLALVEADVNQIKNGVAYYCPIMPERQHMSTFYGLAKAAGDSTQSASSNAVGAYTDQAKGMIQAMLGVAQMLSSSVETSATASVNHAVGSLFAYNGSLYKTTATIASGTVITPGVNCAATTVEELISASSGGEKPWNTSHFSISDESGYTKTFTIPNNGVISEIIVYGAFVCNEYDGVQIFMGDNNYSIVGYISGMPAFSAENKYFGFYAHRANDMWFGQAGFSKWAVRQSAFTYNIVPRQSNDGTGNIIIGSVWKNKTFIEGTDFDIWWR